VEINKVINNLFLNKKVFITGHTGFKGSWLLCWLHDMGAILKGYALDPVNKKDLFNQINGSKLCTSVIADIRNLENLKTEIISFQPDYIFHLAAQPLVLESYLNPIYTHEVNIIGTANVLESIRLLEKACVAVMITTDKVYYNYEKGKAYNEEDRLGGFDPYSSSKSAAELIIDSYRKSFFNPIDYKKHKKSISVARAGNVIGGGDWSKDRIIPDLIKALLKDENIKLRNPDAIRPWQHVIEPLWGYLKLALKQNSDPIYFSDCFNFGPHLSDNITVFELVQIATKIWGSGGIDIVEGNKLHEAKLLQLDISKAINKINWHPKYNSGVAIKKTIEWYYNIEKLGIDPYEVTIRQIREYSKTFHDSP
jgi:CDP-glucose 4,6-dehydratase